MGGAPGSCPTLTPSNPRCWENTQQHPGSLHPKAGGEERKGAVALPLATPD